MIFKATASTIATPPVRPLAQRILANRGYDIEFQGYLSNHAKHAIVALDRLDASDVRIQEYWDTYTKLTPYQIPLHPINPSEWEAIERQSASSMSQEEFVELRGKKQDWKEMVVMLRDEMKNAGDTRTDEDKTNDLVRKYAPGMLGGVASGLTHGIIHLGWGLDARSPWMTVEGLAYLNFCHVPFGPELESNGYEDEDTPMASLKRICRTWHDEGLAESWVAATKAKYDESFHPELVPSGFQWHVAKTMQDAYPIVTHLPGWLRSKSLDFEAKGGVWETMYRIMTILYLATRDGPHGNFVVLHLLTSLWGLEKVCRILLLGGQCGMDGNEDAEQTVRKALESHWAATICLLATSSLGIPPYEQLERTFQQFRPSSFDDADYSWDDVVSRGIAEDEEHNIKLAYVSRELWKRYGMWSGFSEAGRSFTLTPNIRPSSTSFD